MLGGGIDSVYSQDKNIGTIGVVGCQYISTCPCEWWFQGPHVGGIRQGMKDADGNYYVVKPKVLSNKVRDAVVVDGLFIAIRREMFDENLICWDFNTFHGFHMYDMDICIQTIVAGKRVVTVPIDIEHKSEGNVDEIYHSNLRVLYDKWKTFLPLARGVEVFPIEPDWHYGYGEFAYHKLMYDYAMMRNSKAYRIGKLILKPYTWIKRHL